MSQQGVHPTQWGTKKYNIGKVTSRRHISSEEWQGMNREQASSLWSWVR